LTAYELGKQDARNMVAYANPYDCYTKEWRDYRQAYYTNTPPYIWPTAR